MLTFWLIAGLLTAVTLYFVLRPLLKADNENDIERETHIIGIHKERLQQLESQLNRKEITEAQFKEAQEELAVNLASELPETSSATKDDGATSQHWLDTPLARILLPALLRVLFRSVFPPLFKGLVFIFTPAAKALQKHIGWVVGVGIPVITLALYVNIGNLQALNGIEQTAADKDPNLAQYEQIQGMIEQLENRLKEDPKDLQGWSMLIRSYSALNQLERAHNTILLAEQHFPGHPNLLLSLAELLATKDKGNLLGEPAILIKKAMQADPTNRYGRYLLGMLAHQKGDTEIAITAWQSLIDDGQSTPQEVATLQQFITEAKAGSGQAADNTTPAESSGPSVTVAVSLSPALQAKVQPSDALFIFARAENGPPMPLAIYRGNARELPLTVTLSDANAMMPQMKISMFPSVIVGARISKTGDAIASSGDLQGLSQPLDPKSNPNIDIEIADLVP